MVCGYNADLIRTLTVSLVCGYNAEHYHDTERKFCLWIQCWTLDRKFGLWIQCWTFDREFGLWISLTVSLFVDTMLDLLRTLDVSFLNVSLVCGYNA